MPPSIRGTPQRRQKTPNTASSSATRRSHQSASSSPPATAYPLTAAITGLVSSQPRGAHRVRRPPARRGCRARCRWPSGRRPRRTCRPRPTAPPPRASGSASKARNASASAAPVGPSTALRASGRESTTVVTAPARSVRTEELLTNRPPRRERVRAGGASDRSGRDDRNGRVGPERTRRPGTDATARNGTEPSLSRGPAALQALGVTAGGLWGPPPVPPVSHRVPFVTPPCLKSTSRCMRRGGVDSGASITVARMFGPARLRALALTLFAATAWSVDDALCPR